jgi:hypothetical protein
LYQRVKLVSVIEIDEQQELLFLAKEITYNFLDIKERVHF